MNPIGQMTREEVEWVEQALAAGKVLEIDWGGPATTIGERVRRNLWALYFNQRAEEVGSPLRIRFPGEER